MKHIYLNLKRFDISAGSRRREPACAHGGLGASIVRGTQEALKAWPEAEYVMFFPEAHLLAAAAARSEGSPVKVGCQGVYRADTAIGGNFGAFTSNRTANAAAELGCESALIGHCEERGDKMACWPRRA